MTNVEPDWAKAQRLEREKTLAGVRGLFAANLFIWVPPLVSLVILHIFGEGAYLMPLMAIMWGILFFYGKRMRSLAAVGTFKRSQGFWVAFWSFILAAATLAVSAAYLSNGHWPYKPPEWLSS